VSFHGLSKEERAEWRNLPATKAAFAFIKSTGQDRAQMALNSALSGDMGSAQSHAGAWKALEIIADQLERD